MPSGVVTYIGRALGGQLVHILMGNLRTKAEACLAQGHTGMRLRTRTQPFRNIFSITIDIRCYLLFVPPHLAPHIVITILLTIRPMLNLTIFYKLALLSPFTFSQ